MKTWEDRFWAKIEKTEGCWLWTACTDAISGYGRVTINKTTRYAHRVAYEIENGPIPTGMTIDHRCRTRSCVNPGHLRLATNKQNAENVATDTQSKSGIRGVVWYAPRRRWAAKAKHNGHTYYAGYHRTIAEAAAAVIALRNELFTHNDADRMANK
jgi:hypothetical protein